MNIVVFHGSPRKGNTYTATAYFMDELSKLGDIRSSEFFLPEAMPVFCTGCQLCLGNPCEKCPHSQYVTPLLGAILTADALVFTTPHFGACSMSGCMKNLLDHLDFLTLTVAPRVEMFRKKAFLISTGAGSAAATKPIMKYLKNWGVNRVYSLGIRMLINQWDKMPAAKQTKSEKALRRAARRFYGVPQKRPYISTTILYHINKYILMKYIGEGNYPYEYWKEHGYFKKRPF